MRNQNRLFSVLAIAFISGSLNIIAYAADSMHDFTGIWLRVGSLSFDPTVKNYFDELPPLTPAYAKIWKERIDAANKGTPIADPTAGCLPPGMPRFMTLVFPGEIIQNERQMNIFSEWNEETRRIFLDGRSPPDDLYPTFKGFSTGHWEGNNLIVKTIGLRGDTNFDAGGIPHSDALTVSERLWLSDDRNTLKDEMTADDPKALTQPWVVTKTYKRAPENFRLMEFVCAENNRNPPNAKGETSTTLAKPK